MTAKARRALKHKKRCEAKALQVQANPVAQSFTIFGRLPPELRLKIWTFALQRRGFIEVHTKTRSKKGGDKEIVFTTLSRLPWGVMMACKASWVSFF